MPFSNSFSASLRSSTENTPVSPNNFNHSISQSAFVSAMVNHSRPALSSQALIRSGYSGAGNTERHGSNNLTPRAQGVVYVPSAIGNSNIFPLPAPAASRAVDLVRGQQTSGSLVPPDYSQLPTENMEGINRGSLYNLSDHFAPNTRETVSPPLATGSNTNISFESSKVPSLINLLQAQQTYRAYCIAAQQMSGGYNQIAAQQISGANNQISAQQTSGANNIVPSQLPGASWDGNFIQAQKVCWPLLFSDHPKISNSGGMGQINPAMLYKCSGSFAGQSNEMVSSAFASVSIASWLDMVTAPSSPTALCSGAFITERTNYNVDSLVCLSAKPLSSGILPVHDHSDPGKSAVSNRHVYQCSECPARFFRPQAFGGHMSFHTKEKKKQDKLASMLRAPKELNLMPSISLGRAKDAGGSGAYKKKGESTKKKNNKRGNHSQDRSTPADVDKAIETEETPVKASDDAIEE